MTQLPLRFVFFSLALALFLGQQGRSDEPHLTFEKDVRPILKAHCFHCHGEDGEKQGGLDLRLRRLLIEGGDSGPALIPEKSAKSLVIDRIESGEMPPENKKISSAELATLRTWIEQGARTAREEPLSVSDSLLTEEEKSFWSFQPVRKVKVPKLANYDLARNPIDLFILRKLQSNGITFSQRASKTTLIRRVYFDLIGLPPSPEDVADFLNDSAPGAYERLVDRLLASPSYGEHWGRHWLDVAGYADSEGYTDRDPERDSAFFYRDYVIESFNEGKPFDRFVIEQLAGDELVDSPLQQLSDKDKKLLMATGFLRMAADGTATGGVDRAEAANETISDTINIVSTSLLGLTVGCARCHNHRYDPISQKDYYRLRAVFEPALDWKNWKTPQQRKISLYTSQEREIRVGIEQRAKAVEKDRLDRQAAHIERTLQEELLVAPDDKREQLRIAYKTAKAKRTEAQKKLLEEYPNIQNISPGSLYLYAEQRGRRANEIKAEGEKRLKLAIDRLRKERLEKVPEADRDEVAVLLEHDPENLSDAEKKLRENYSDVFVDLPSLEKLDPKAYREYKQYLEAARICRETDAKKELAEMAAEAGKIRSTAPREFFVRALVEPKNHAPKTFLFKRGNHGQPGQQVLPGELEVLSQNSHLKIPENDAQRPTTGRRLAYAKHLTDGKHPLVARVIVNRIWMEHFGHGLVRTTGDFGILGTPPTHPELLDWLSNELVESDWNIKHVQKLILNSHTYQQVSSRTRKLDEIDPDNLLYARRSISRLKSESIRDAVLAVSGRLVNKMGGPPIPVKEDAVGQIVLGKQKLDGERKPQPGNQLGAEAERRSLYVQVRRTRPLAVLETFDIATQTPNCVQRHSSNVAPQALMLMNSDFVVRYAGYLAERVRRQTPDQRLQIRHAFELCFSRKPDSGTEDELLDFLVKQIKEYSMANPKLGKEKTEKMALANVCHALLSSNEFLYID